MTYEQTITYLYNSTPVFEHVGSSAYKPGLATTLALDEHFGHPHNSYKTIHVAGTNGKGSVSHSLAAVLQEAGFKVGLYTSPHLVDFRERIRVNGQCISKKRVVDFVQKEREFFEPLHPSFFELTTALAFLYFKEQKVDIAIMEVGLGGRLDCTNIITPVLSVITNISFDHMEFLGKSLKQIASEKAGIIKRGVPVVIGETDEETRPVFEQKAKEMEAPIFFAEEFQMPYPLPKFQLKGYYQEKNLRTILCALDCLNSLKREKNGEREETTEEKGKKWNVEKALTHVCELTGLRGRWEVLSDNPRVICDTGHNVAAWQYLSRQIKEQEAKTTRIVFGMVDDKDIDTVMEMLPKNAVYYFTQAQTKRAIPATIVAEKGLRHGLQGKSYTDVYKAYEQALSEASRDDFIFIGGSSYVVADLLAALPSTPNI